MMERCPLSLFQSPQTGHQTKIGTDKNRRQLHILYSTFVPKVHMGLHVYVPAAEPAALLGPTATDVAVPPRLLALTFVTALSAATVVAAAEKEDCQYAINASMHESCLAFAQEVPGRTYHPQKNSAPSLPHNLIAFGPV